MKQIIVVAGGYTSEQKETCDILDLETLTWSTGPPPPGDICSSASVPYGNTFLKVGGYCSNVVMEFDGCAMDWIVRPETYEYSYDDPTAVLIEDSLFESYCSAP